MSKEINVAFVDEKIKKAFEKLDDRKSDEKQLRIFILRAIDDLKKNPRCGILIPRRLIPKVYIQKYEVQNIWKYNLPNAWRLIYSIEEDQVSIMSIIVEWFKHKDYERRFKY